MSLPKKLIDEQFSLVRALGNGGQSRTYIVERRDWQGLLKRPLSADLSREQRFRFRQEAEALGMLDGNGVPKVIDYAFDGDEPYILMELIPGRTLSEHVNGRALEESVAVEITRKLASILSSMHEIGMQHRDIKPDNVLIHANGEVYLIDFGLCRIENDRKDYETPAGKE